MMKIQAAVCVDVELDIRTDRLAHGMHTRRIRLNDSGQWFRLAARERFVADHHLQPPIALLHPELCSGRELLPIEEIEPNVA
jgi:hypothetical protein